MFGLRMPVRWMGLLVVAVTVASVLDEDSGVRPWLRMSQRLATVDARIAELRGDVSRLAEEARALEAEPFALERAAREELGLARPGETVVRLAPRRTFKPPISLTNSQ